MSPLIPPQIAAGLEAGRKTSNLAFALRRLPPARRRDALEFYRFCRIVDDIADSDLLEISEKETALAAWLDTFTRHDLSALPSGLARIIDLHNLDLHLLAEIVEGMRMDLHRTRYATFDDLRLYCWRAAGAVGILSTRIFGCISPQSRTYAEHLGLALQLTNILRDIAEDAARDRIYLPQSDLSKFGIPESDLLSGKHTPAFARLMAFEADRAGQCFQQAAAALPAADSAALRPAETMRAIYSTLLSRMRADGFRVFEKRYRLGRLEKLLILLRS